jgi:hypothetical protein
MTKAQASAILAQGAAGPGGSGGGGGGILMRTYASGGMVAKYLKGGGMPDWAKPRGTDTIPAMLTPGEFVMRKYAVDKFGVDKMKAINNGSYSGDSVYNYEVNINVKSESNPNDIARVVIERIRQIDSQKLRRVNF